MEPQEQQPQPVSRPQEQPQAQSQGDSRPPRRLSRRQVIKYGLCGAACIAGGATAWRLLGGGLGKLGEAFSPTALDIFPGDAPKGELWEAWKHRGWAREAYHYLKLGRNVQCKICPNACVLAPDDRGRCRTRVNKDGTLYTLAYGNPVMFHVDPIEKKPLFHFLPGKKAFSLATAGCVLRCLNCQNWDISQRKPEEVKDPRGENFILTPNRALVLTARQADRYSLFADDVVDMAKYHDIASIAYTYSEPIAYYEYAYDTCKAARNKGVKNILVTCGHINREALIDICQYADAASVNLKSFSDEIYSRLNAGKVQAVLDTLLTLKERGVWFEVINLIVPTYTDKPDMIRRMCEWLAAKIGPDCPLHFSRFHPQHKLTYLSPTPADILAQARDIARQAGLRYVYIGNIQGIEGAEDTICPSCKKTLVARAGFAIRENNIEDGKCRSCRAAIAGVWA